MTTPPPPQWANQPVPAPTPPPPTGQPAGWYPDPWGQAPWRWYDGHAWTAHISVGQAVSGTGATGVAGSQSAQQPKKPRLPSFLSIPVILAAIPSLILLGIALFTNPKTVALGIVPLLIVGPVLVWMDRLEPEPWSSRLHAFLWGAFVAGIISLVVNTLFATITGSEVAAAVVSAPFIEELTKTFGILWMVRRKEVDSIMDGLVYAGWVALGFAAIENVSYFYLADEQDLLWETFVGRALFTPFAHPLFTAWAGLAIGVAIRARKSLWTSIWGLALAMLSHAAWNGSLSLAETEGGAIVTAVVIIGFIILFIATIVGVIVLQSRARKRYAELLPFIASRYGLPPDRVATMMTSSSRRTARKALSSKAEKQRFDDEAGAIARLAAMLDHDGTADPEHEARLVSQLAAARNGTSS